MDRGVWWVAVHRVQRVDRTETLSMQTCIHTHTGTCHTSLSISLLLTFSSLSCFHIVLIVNMLLSTSVFIFLAYVFADLDHNIGHVLVLYFLSSSDLIHLRVYMIVCISNPVFSLCMNEFRVSIFPMLCVHIPRKFYHLFYLFYQTVELMFLNCDVGEDS